MKAGSKIRYVDEGGEEHAAVVGEITGTGDSLYKIVSLVYRVDGREKLVEHVPHENDVLDEETGEPNAPHWHEVGAARRQKQPPLPEPPPGGGVPSGEPPRGRVPDVEALRAEAEEEVEDTPKKRKR